MCVVLSCVSNVRTHREWLVVSLHLHPCRVYAYSINHVILILFNLMILLFFSSTLCFSPSFVFDVFLPFSFRFFFRL